jgi:hypothetical protein
MTTIVKNNTNNLSKDELFTQEYLWMLSQIHPDQFGEKAANWYYLVDKNPTFDNVYDMVNDLLCVTNDNGKVIDGITLFKKVYKVHKWTNTPSKKVSMDKNYENVKNIWLKLLCEQFNIGK